MDFMGLPLNIKVKLFHCSDLHNHDDGINIRAAFRGMHVSPAKHTCSYA